MDRAVREGSSGEGEVGKGKGREEEVFNRRTLCVEASIHVVCD